MTSDDLLGEIDQLQRFRPFIMSLAEIEDGEDAATALLNTLFGLAPDLWRSGERRTIGQSIALGRGGDEDSADARECRRALAQNGMRLERLDGETWSQAWLAVANNHAGLDKLLTAYPSYQGGSRSQILRRLRGIVHGVEYKELSPEVGDGLIVQAAAVAA